MMRFIFSLSLLLSMSVLAVEHTSVSSERLLQAQKESQNWLMHGKSYDESRFSELKSINSDSVKQLGLAWSFEFPDNRGLEATPIVVDGVIYTSGAWSRVYAHNAKTGELLWQYDPKVAKSALVKGCCGPVNRGVAVWEDKLFVGTLDGYLIAVNRSTGEEVWRTLTIDADKDYTITGAPRVVKGNVLIGNGGAEYGVRGYVSAYNANSGELSWRFYTVPNNPAESFENAAMEMAAKTWNGEWWKLGGGGTVWDSMSYDPELNLVYIGVGNGSPWNQEIRSPGGGDNLFLSSIVALNADTGDYVWHYQTTPGESWDFTATQQIVLADIMWQGKLRKVLMQAPKNGFFFIIDRVTGEFLSAEPFSKVVWAKGYDKAGRPIENPEARYKDKPMLMMPGAIGAHNWHSMSYSHETGLVYIPVIKGMMNYGQPASFKPAKQHQNVGVDFITDVLINRDFMLVLTEKATRGELVAWNPVEQKQQWSYKHKRGWNGGVLATAGNVVFQGTADQQFMAFDAKTGNVLWSFDAKLAIIAAPITYSVDGEQFVAVVAKWGGGYPLAVGLPPLAGLDKGRLLVFSLNGKALLPDANISKLTMNKPQEQTITDEGILKEGAKDYLLYCAGCHGMNVISGGNVPDLRYRASQYNFDTFKLFVLEGVSANNGMVSFSDVLDEAKANNIYNYILQEAHAEFTQTQKGSSNAVIQSIYSALATVMILAAEGATSFYIGVALFWLLVALLFWRLFRRKKSR
jgi:PQQ-dependent dehydrogenase (methanol/ethanol family)